MSFQLQNISTLTLKNIWSWCFFSSKNATHRRQYRRHIDILLKCVTIKRNSEACLFPYGNVMKLQMVVSLQVQNQTVCQSVTLLAPLTCQQLVCWVLFSGTRGVITVSCNIFHGRSGLVCPKSRNAAGIPMR